MIVTPAIDLRGGRCVQLVGGSYDRQMVELDDPVAVAARWEADGFSTLHVVDLDGATGRGSNEGIVARILGLTRVDVQVGGGLRSTTAVERMISAGASRVIVGTRALEDRAWLEELSAKYPERVVVAADIRDRAVVTHGWKEQRARNLHDEIAALNDLPLAALLVTAVHREGLMNGPDLSLVRETVEISSFPIQASGGVGGIEDLCALAELGVSATIVGMALYTGALSATEIQKELSK